MGEKVSKNVKNTGKVREFQEEKGGNPNESLFSNHSGIEEPSYEFRGKKLNAPEYIILVHSRIVCEF